MIQINNILVPTDQSSTSTKALHYAIELSRLNSATIHLLHVVDDRVMGYLALGDQLNIALNQENFQEKMLDVMASELENSVKGEVPAGINVEKKVILGKPSDEICDYANQIHADLIVMGTHGRTGLTHLLLGSVAERVIRSARRPVLVVKPDEHEFIS